MFHFLNMVKRANKNDLNNIILRKEAVNACFSIFLLRKMLKKNRVITKSCTSLVVILNQFP